MSKNTANPRDFTFEQTICRLAHWTRRFCCSRCYLQQIISDRDLLSRRKPWATNAPASKKTANPSLLCPRFPLFSEEQQKREGNIVRENLNAASAEILIRARYLQPRHLSI
jgi:hypothetical protein